jgi:hypothetical protein
MHRYYRVGVFTSTGTACVKAVQDFVGRKIGFYILMEEYRDNPQTGFVDGIQYLSNVMHARICTPTRHTVDAHTQ